MLKALMYGWLTGLGLSWTFGTVFFVLLQTSMEQGWRKGLLIAAGVAFSDLIFILLAVAGVSAISAFLSQHQQGILMVGGSLLLLLGLRMFFRKNVPVKVPGSRLGSFMFFFTTGVLLNVLNPVNFFTWVAITTACYQVYTAPQMALYFAACTITIFSCQWLIAYSAHALKRFFTARTMRMIDITSGIAFCGIGIYFIIHAVQ